MFSIIKLLSIVTMQQSIEPIGDNVLANDFSREHNKPYTARDCFVNDDWPNV
jgi:hypothetical protein